MAGPSADREEMYRSIIRDVRTTATLKRAVNGIEKALLLLNGNRDHAVIAFLSDLRARALTLVGELEAYQANPTPIEEPKIISRIQGVYIACNA